MPAERLSMRKIREVLRLRALGLSKREIAQSISIGATTVLDYQRRADRAGVSWPLPEDWDDARLERELFEDAEPPVASAELSVTTSWSNLDEFPPASSRSPPPPRTT